ncbi:MAG: agmatine deiminase family protein [Acidobacteriota bacterium]
MSTPLEKGFTMPPEWAPHTACWMGWPCSLKTHPDLEAARDAYAAIARAIAAFEPLIMLTNPAEAKDAGRRCGDAVRIVSWPIDDAWTRDTGPTYVIDGGGGLGGVDWPFNGYGKFPDYEEDARMASRILEHTRARRFEAPIILEGGGIHTDGEGTLLTTENVVLNPNRNPGLTRKEADEVFRNFLGVENVIWLDKAMDFDDTDGHIDNLATFVAPGVVAALSEVDPSDSQYAALQENLRRLKKATDAKGRPLEILEIRQPAWRDFRGKRLAFSYINHYIANGGIVLPTFDDPMDEEAREAFARAFPKRRIAQVPGTEVVKAGGCIHCITQQQPAP